MLANAYNNSITVIDISLIIKQLDWVWNNISNREIRHIVTLTAILSIKIIATIMKFLLSDSVKR